MSEKSRLEAFKVAFPDATPEQLKAAEELIKKGNDATFIPEEQRLLNAVMEDINESLPEREREVNEKLREKLQGGGEEEKPAIEFQCPLCKTT